MDVLLALIFLILGIASTLLGCGCYYIYGKFIEYKKESVKELGSLQEINVSLSSGLKDLIEVKRDIEMLKINQNMRRK